MSKRVKELVPGSNRIWLVPASQGGSFATANLVSPMTEQASPFENILPPEDGNHSIDSTRHRSVAKYNEQKPSRNRPCDACRRRKSRCVLNDGASKCVLCNFHSQDCTFLENVIPRKRKSVSYEGDATRSPEHDVSPSQPESFTRYHAQRMAVEDYANIKGPSLLKRTLGLQRRHHGLHVGSSSRVEPALLTGSFKLLKAHQNISFQNVSINDLFVLHPDQGTELYEDEIDDLDAIESLVAPRGRALINLYFRIVHPSFPILHKKVYLEKYERTHQEFSPVLLAAVYILATNYWSYSPELSDSAIPDVQSLQRLALKCMNYAIHRPKISTVEAGLLLLQTPSEAAWPLTAQMVAVGQDLGLHRDCSDWDIPGWEKRLRKRLAWGLYMQDKWASLVYGRPSHIFTTDWHVQSLVESDFPENVADENDEEGSTEVEKGRAIFICMVSLTQILSDILSSLYCGAAEEDSRARQDDATTNVLRKAKALQIRLKEWYAQLSDSLSIKHVTPRKLSSSGYLHLAYWSLELNLHRAILRTLSSCTDTALIKICQDAALARSRSAMEFVNCLKPEHWQSFWYSTSEYGFGLIGIFEALLSTTYTSIEDLRESSKRLEHYKWTLKMAKKNAEFLEKSLATMNPALSIANRRIPDFSNSTSSEHKDAQTVQTARPHQMPDEYGKQSYHQPDEHPTPAYTTDLSSFHTDTYQEQSEYDFFDMDLAMEHTYTG